MLIAAGGSARCPPDCMHRNSVYSDASIFELELKLLQARQKNALTLEFIFRTCYTARLRQSNKGGGHDENPIFGTTSCVVSTRYG